MKDNVVRLTEMRSPVEPRAEFDARKPKYVNMQPMVNARKNSGITQDQLADWTGISQGNISRIETGEANPSLKTLRKLADGMNMDISIVFSPINKGK